MARGRELLGLARRNGGRRGSHGDTQQRQRICWLTNQGLDDSDRSPRYNQDRYQSAEHSNAHSCISSKHGAPLSPLLGARYEEQLNIEQIVAAPTDS